MPFPVNPEGLERDDRGLFLVQDLDIRSKVLPLFRIDPAALEKRPIGQGTCFRIDPWNMCATAFHVVEDLIEPNNEADNVQIRKNVSLVALEFPGVVFGTVRVPDDWWRAPEGLSAPFIGLEMRPFQKVQIRNLTELAALWITSVQPRSLVPTYLPVDLSWRPQVGATVMALGYAGLDVEPEGRGEERPLQQYIFGSTGEIIDVVPADFL